jgi:hypothetical protein
MFWRPRGRQEGSRQRLSRPVGCLLWLIALLVVLLVLSLLFGGFQQGTKVGAPQLGERRTAAPAASARPR